MPLPRESDSATHLSQVIERALARAVRRGELAVAWLRILIAVPVIGAVFYFRGLQYVLEGRPRTVIILSGLALGAGLSGWMVVWLRRHDVSRALLAASVTLDAALIFVAVLPTALWPRPDYPGQIHLPGVFFFLLAIIVASFRLDRQIVWIAAGLECACLAVVLSVDQISGISAVETTAFDWVIYAILVLGTVLVADALTRRINLLVMDSAQSLLMEERARRALDVYVSEEVAEQALEGGVLKPGGERREVSVLFSDLRSFTPYAEGIPPEQLVKELNAYLDAMVSAIRIEGGVIDKYIGDAIMVVFGVPRSRPDDAARAIRTAWRMEQALIAHNRERTAQGLPPFVHGIGVHHGPAIAGNIGSGGRLQYTVIGDVVNLAAGLESATKDYRWPILVSRDALHAAGDLGEEIPRLESIGEISIKGRQGHLVAFCLGDPAQPRGGCEEPPGELSRP